MDTRNIDVHRGRLGEEKLLATLARETFWETYSLENSTADMQMYMDEAFSENQIRKELMDPGSLFYILLVENQAAGYVKGKRVINPPLPLAGVVFWIDRIYLYSTFQYQGLGTILMEQLVEFSLKNGWKGIGLSVWEKNLLAISFYLKWGFEKVGEETFLLGKELQNDWVMFKSLEREVASTMEKLNNLPD
ncbi:MAG: GNAT family N-acetyltransferase [Chitinophagaceae bacterium]